MFSSNPYKIVCEIWKSVNINLNDPLNYLYWWLVASILQIYGSTTYILFCFNQNCYWICMNRICTFVCYRVYSLYRNSVLFHELYLWQHSLILFLLSCLTFVVFFFLQVLMEIYQLSWKQFVLFLFSFEDCYHIYLVEGIDKMFIYYK